MFKAHITRYIITFTIIVLVSGCSSTKPSRLYVLSAPESMPVAAIYHEHLAGAGVSVMRVQIPKHHDRPAIVTRSDGPHLVYSEFHRWGEPLADNLSGALVLNLDTLLPNSIVLGERAMRNMDVNYRVQVTVLRMSGKLGKTAGLTARWSIFTGDEEELLRTQVYRGTKELATEEYAAYVSALSELTTALSGDIAKALQAVPITARDE